MSYTPPLCLAIMIVTVIYSFFTWNRREFGLSIAAALISTFIQLLVGMGVIYFTRAVSGHIVMMNLPRGHQIINLLVYVAAVIALHFVAKWIGRFVSSFFNTRTREN